MAKKKQIAVQPALIRDRVVELRRVKASTLISNDANWRTHPSEQRSAMSSMLEKIGFAGGVIAREMPDGSLLLLDGHMRAEEAGNSIIPVQILDVNDAEADAILATYNAVGLMGDTDAAKLNALLANVEIQDAGLAAMLGDMAYIPDIDKDSEEATEILEGQQEAIDAFLALKKRSRARAANSVEENFYIAIIFQSWAQKQEFLLQIPDIPVLYGMYADGQVMATRIGMPVTPNTQRPMHSPLDKKLKAMAMLPPEDLD